MRLQVLVILGIFLLHSLPASGLEKREASEILHHAMMNFRKAIEAQDRFEQKKYLAKAVEHFRRVVCNPELDQFSHEWIPRLARELPNRYIRSLYFYVLFVSFNSCERFVPAKSCLERAMETHPNPPPEWSKDLERVNESIRRKEGHSE